MDHGCLLIRQSIGNQLSKKIDGGQSSLMLGGSKLRNIVKSLLQLGKTSTLLIRTCKRCVHTMVSSLLSGANLAQSREYRDVLEDILTKVVEPLEEANLAAHEMNNFLAACYLLIAELPEKSPAYGSALSTPMTSARTSSQHAYFHHTSSVGSINEAIATGQAPPPPSPYMTSTGSLGSSSITVANGNGTENTAVLNNNSTIPQGGSQTLSSAAATTLSTINAPLQGGSNNPMISGANTSSSLSGTSGNMNTNTNASSGSQLSISTNFYPNASMKISSNRNDILKKDWLRFIAFVKLSVFQLMGERK